MPEILNQNLTLSFDFMVGAYIALFSLFFLLFVFMLGYIFSKLRTYNEDPLDLALSSYNKALHILDAAKKQSLKIYKESQERAKKIIGEAYDFKANSKEDLDSHLAVVTKNQLEDFDKFLKSELEGFEDMASKETKSSVEMLSRLSRELEKGVEEGIKGLKDNVVRETFESQKLVDKKIEEEYAELEKELTEYKKEKMKVIDDGMNNLLCEISSKILGVSFSVNDHQDIILNILEDAKKKEQLNF